MYRAKEIRSALLNVIGWRQNYDTASLCISDELTKSETGQYFQDIHPLLTLDNICSVAPDFTRVDYPEWNMSLEYQKGQIVKLKAVTMNSDFNNDFAKKTGYKAYRALTNNTGKNPEISTDDWQLVDFFSEWLQQKTEASILKAVETYYSANMATKTVRNVLESKVLFDGAGRLSDLMRNTNSIVGFEIVPIRAEGVTLKIEKIGLQFNKNGNFKMYLMHSSSPAPIQEIDVNYTKSGGMQWLDMPDMYLPYMSDDTDAGGSWFLCYNQKELPEGMQAIRKNRDWSKAPCNTCNRIDYLNWQAWSRYLEVHPFRVPATENNEMWDVQNNIYDYQTNYGINLKVTMECDLTQIIIDQRFAFQNVIALQMAADMIREFAYNPSFRINRTQQNFSRNELLYELDGDSQGYKKSGLLYRLEKAFEALKVDMSGLNRICMPCQNGGLRYYTV